MWLVHTDKYNSLFNKYVDFFVNKKIILMDDLSRGIENTKKCTVNEIHSKFKIRIWI